MVTSSICDYKLNARMCIREDCHHWICLCVITGVSFLQSLCCSTERLVFDSPVVNYIWIKYVRWLHWSDVTALKKQGTIKKIEKHNTMDWGRRKQERRKLVWTSPSRSLTVSGNSTLRSRIWLNISLLAMLQKLLCSVTQLHWIYKVLKMIPSSDYKVKQHHNTQKNIIKPVTMTFVLFAQQGNPAFDCWTFSHWPLFKGGCPYSAPLLSVSFRELSVKIYPIDCQCKHILRCQWKAIGRNNLVYASQNVVLCVCRWHQCTFEKNAFMMIYSGAVTWFFLPL